MRQARKFSLNSTKATELLRQLQPYEFVVIVTHDSPDADGIAASWAIKHLIDEETTCETRIICGGKILCPETRRLMALLDPPVELLDEYFVVDNVALIFVDCEPDANPHLVDSQLFNPVAVIHHHALPHTSDLHAHPPIIDIRTEVSSASAIAASYLMELEIEPGEKLATALIHGIRRETRGSQSPAKEFDRLVLDWLKTRANPFILRDIENASQSSGSDGDFTPALQS